jgi:hypothetical protein
MMIQSLANIQLEQVKKMFKDIPMKISTLIKRMPPELKCFGFKITDFDISFKKSQMQISAYQKPVEEGEISEEKC